MYISSLRHGNRNPFPIKLIFSLLVVLVLCVTLTVRFLFIAAPFAENRARYLAIDIINTGVSDYLRRKGDIFNEIIFLNSAPNGNIASASVNTKNLNVIKSELTKEINNLLCNDKTYTVKVPLANYLGLTFLSGIGAPIKLKMYPVSRVLIDFENNFSATGINQTHLTLNLKVRASVIVIIPGLRRSVTVETDIPVGEAVFMGDVPQYYAPGNSLPVAPLN